MIFTFAKFKQPRDLHVAYKCAFWRQLPWILCSLVHPDNNVAQQTIKAAIELAAYVEDCTAEHPITQDLMQPNSPGRAMLDTIVQEFNFVACHVLNRMHQIIVVELFLANVHIRIKRVTTHVSF